MTVCMRSCRSGVFLSVNGRRRFSSRCIGDNIEPMVLGLVESRIGNLEISFGLNKLA
jgi:hypothetical protein